MGAYAFGDVAGHPEVTLLLAGYEGVVLFGREPTYGSRVFQMALL